LLDEFHDTLVDEKYSIRQRWQKVLSQYSFLSPDLEKTFFEVYRQKGPSYKFHVNDTLKKIKIDQKFAKEIISKFLKVKAKEMLLDGSTEILEFLKSKNIRVGILTNGIKSHQENRIKRTGLYDYMDFIYYGDEEKKPQKELFLKCLSSFNQDSPEKFLYVGDDPINDINGATSIGARACWITKERKNIRNPWVIKAKNLKELLKYFEISYE